MGVLERLEQGASLLRRTRLGGLLVDRVGGLLGGVVARRPVSLDGFQLAGSNAGHLYYLRELGTGRESYLGELLETSAKPGGVAVDGGAQLGYFALRMARAGSNVVAFEPNPDVFGALRRNVQRNGFASQVELRREALGASASTARLSLRGDESTLAETSGARAVTVPVVALDEYLEEPPDVVKLDLEGWEIAALNGMRRTLAAPHVVVAVECNPAALSAAGSSADELVSLLRGYGFVVSMVDEEARRVRPFEGVTDIEYVNLFCTRDVGG